MLWPWKCWKIKLYPTSDWRTERLGECVEADLTLNAGQQQEFEALLRQERYQNVIPTMLTTFEKGKLEGVLEGKRHLARLLLEDMFGPLPKDALQRLETLPTERLDALARAVKDANSLSALGLEG
jgi:hypothetical protein